MDLLILLVEERDRLVPRNEIVERLWGPDVFLEVDASVNTLVRKLRRVLGDAVEHPRFIQTVQGKGYRFIARVETTFPIAGGPQIEASAPAAIRTIAGAGDVAATQRDPAAADGDPLQRSKPSPMPFALSGLSGRQRAAASVALLVGTQRLDDARRAHGVEPASPEQSGAPAARRGDAFRKPHG